MRAYTLRQIAIAINAAQPRWHIGQRATQKMMDTACGVPMGSKVPWKVVEQALRQHWLFYWINGENGLEKVRVYLAERWG